MTEVSFDIFIKQNGKTILSPLYVSLLQEIEKSGSLRIATKRLGISYQHLWQLVKEINISAKEPLIIKKRGGVGGGGAILSQYGKILLNEYSIIEKQIIKFQNQLNTEINL